MDCSPPGSSIHRVLQAEILEWAVIPFSRGSSRPMDRTRVACSLLSKLPGKPICLPAAAAKSLQLCLTLCDPIDGSPRGSPVPGILQARTLEWVAIAFSNAGKWKVKLKSLSLVRLLAIPWTAVHQAPPSMGFSRQEYWSGVPLPSPIGAYIWAMILVHAWFPGFFFTSS